MLNKIVEYFKTSIEATAKEPGQSENKRIPIATCALLLEMAHADSEFNEIEEQKIISILKQKFNLSDDDASHLMELAILEREESLDLWQFTNLINDNFGKNEKIKVLETLWQVIYADGRVDMYEEYLMRRLSNLLNMEHKEMIDAKIRARNMT